MSRINMIGLNVCSGNHSKIRYVLVWVQVNMVQVTDGQLDGREVRNRVVKRVDNVHVKATNGIRNFTEMTYSTT